MPIEKNTKTTYDNREILRNMKTKVSKVEKAQQKAKTSVQNKKAHKHRPYKREEKGESKQNARQLFYVCPRLTLSIEPSCSFLPENPRLSALSRGIKRANKERKLYHFPRISNFAWNSPLICVPPPSSFQEEKWGMLVCSPAHFPLFLFRGYVPKNKRENRTNNS